MSKHSDRLLRKINLLACFALFSWASALMIGFRGRSAEITWTNAVGGSWSDATNWSPNQVPGSSDTALINVADGTYAVSLNGNATVIDLLLGSANGNQTLTLGTFSLFVSGKATVNAHGTLNVSSGQFEGDCNMAGELNWTGGAIGGAITIATNGMVNIGTTAAKDLLGALTNYGTINSTGSGTITIWNTGTPFGWTGSIYNMGSGTFECQADQLVTRYYVHGTIQNEGLFRKSLGNGTIIIDLPFRNTGSVQVQTGNLVFAGGGLLDGSWNSELGTEINFSAGTFELDAMLNKTGSGLVHFTDGYISFRAPITNFELNGGTLVGTNTVIGQIIWTAGSVDGSITVASNAFLEITGSASKTLLGRLTNYGTTTWSGTGDMGLYNNGSGWFGTIESMQGGTFDVRNSQTFDGTYAYNGFFRNRGIFVKSTGSGVSNFQFPFYNTGAMQVQAGELRLGTFVQTDGILSLEGGNLSGRFFEIDGGILEGSGVISGTLTNDSFIMPGNPIGSLTIYGDYVQTTNGTLSIEITGPTAVSQFDNLSVSGTAALAGSLNLSLPTGFYPPGNSSFSFLTAGSRSGTFDHAPLPSNLGGLYLDYPANAVILRSAGSPPELQPIEDQVIPELVQFSIDVIATDADQAVQTIAYSVTNSPTGVTINSSNGKLQWTPSEIQGPSTNMITVVATDDGTPPLSTSRTFQVIVTDVNTPPVIDSIPNRNVILGDSIMLQVPVNDSDWPSNNLSFALVQGPSGAALGSNDGIFNWTPNATQVPSTNTIVVRVTDDGLPPMSSTATFVIKTALTNDSPIAHPKYFEQAFTWSVMGSGTETWLTSSASLKTNYLADTACPDVSTQTMAVTVSGTAKFNYSLRVGAWFVPASFLLFTIANPPHAHVRILDTSVAPWANVLDAQISTPFGKAEIGSGTFNAISGHVYTTIADLDDIESCASGHSTGPWPDEAAIQTIFPESTEQIAHTGTRAAFASGANFVSPIEGEKDIGGFVATPLPANGGTVDQILYSLSVDNPNVIAYFSDSRTNTTTNAAATVLVRTIAPPIVTLQPVAATFLPGSTAALRVDATGAEPMAFQWLFDDLPMNAESKLSLVITNIGSTNAGVYRAVVSNAVGVVATSPAAIHVLDKPATIGMRPRPTGGFDLELSGTVGVTYELQVSSNLTSWEVLTQIQLNASPNLFTETNGLNSLSRFYRMSVTAH